MPQAPVQSQPPVSIGRVRAWAAPVIVVAIFYAAALPLVWSGNLTGRAAFDQLHFHEPVIRTFAAEWPRPDLSDYRSATTPGYHLVLAAAARAGASSGVALQLVGSVFTAALLGLFAWAATRAAAGVGRGRPALWGVLLTLPLGASLYVFFPGVWLLPDNLGWLLVLAIGLVGVKLAMGGSRGASLVLAAVLLVCVVLVRQSHVWAAAMVWAGAWLGAAPVGAGRVRELLSEPRARVRALVAAVAAALPAVAVLAGFGALWGGLTPPLFAGQYGSIFNPATPAFLLSLVAVLSVFFAGFIAPAGWRIVRERPAVLLFTMLAAVVLAALPETTYVHEPRSTGLWNLVKVGPVIAGHTSVVLLVLAPAGVLALWAWFESLGPRSRWMFLAAIAGFTAAQTANPLCWQRYIEPLLVMAMGLGAASVVGRGRREPEGRTARIIHAARFAGPAALALLSGALTMQRVITADEVWHSEVGPDGRRRVIEGGLVIPGKRFEEQDLPGTGGAGANGR